MSMVQEERLDGLQKTLHELLDTGESTDELPVVEAEE